MGSVQLDGVAWVALYEHIAKGCGWNIAKVRRARNRLRRNGWLLPGTVPGTFRLIAPARATRGRIAA